MPTLTISMLKLRRSSVCAFRNLLQPNDMRCCMEKYMVKYWNFYCIFENYRFPELQHIYILHASQPTPKLYHFKIWLLPNVKKGGRFKGIFFFLFAVQMQYFSVSDYKLKGYVLFTTPLCYQTPWSNHVVHCLKKSNLARKAFRIL